MVWGDLTSWKALERMPHHERTTYYGYISYKQVGSDFWSCQG